LPTPLATCIGILSSKGVRQIHVTETVGKILPMNFRNLDQMQRQRSRESIRQHRHSIFGAFAVANDDFATGEIDILHAKAHRFQNPHARAIEQAADETVNAVEISKHSLNFVRRQDHRKADGALRALDTRKPWQFGAENFLVEKEDGALGLVLRRGGDVVRNCEVRQERFDLHGAELQRMSLVVEDDKSFNPVGIRGLGAEAVMSEPNSLANACEETRRWRGVHVRRADLGSTISTRTLDSWTLSPIAQYDF